MTMTTEDIVRVYRGHEDALHDKDPIKMMNPEYVQEAISLTAAEMGIEKTTVADAVRAGSSMGLFR